MFWNSKVAVYAMVLIYLNCYECYIWLYYISFLHYVVDEPFSWFYFQSSTKWLEYVYYNPEQVFLWTYALISPEDLTNSKHVCEFLHCLL